LNVAAWTFRSGSDAGWVLLPDGTTALLLAKNVPTEENSAAGAHLNGIKGLSADALFTIGFDLVGTDPYCGAGAPRFNVHLAGDPTTHFLGCAAGRSGNHVSFTPGITYGCDTCMIPLGATIDTINIVFDEHGTTHLDNIVVGPFMAGDPGHT
jgi:hypothetical protein